MNTRRKIGLCFAAMSLLAVSYFAIAGVKTTSKERVALHATTSASENSKQPGIPSTVEEVAQRVLRAYENARHLEQTVTSTYYWWDQDSGLHIDLDAFPPPGATKRVKARVEVVCTPGKNRTVMFKAEKRGYLARMFSEPRFTEVVSYVTEGKKFTEINPRSGSVEFFDPRLIPQTEIDVEEPGRFLCETAMWISPLIGKPSHKAEAFARFIKTGRIFETRDDLLIVISESEDESNIFKINRDYLVIEWIKVMPLSGTKRVAYDKIIEVKAFKGGAATGKEGPLDK